MVVVSCYFIRWTTARIYAGSSCVALNSSMILRWRMYVLLHEKPWDCQNYSACGARWQYCFERCGARALLFLCQPEISWILMPFIHGVAHVQLMNPARIASIAEPPCLNCLWLEIHMSRKRTDRRGALSRSMVDCWLLRIDVLQQLCCVCSGYSWHVWYESTASGGKYECQCFSITSTQNFV
jgi:hypothetical protein